MEQHQVLIVGAGPAGSACARALGKAGIGAVILEKEALPRRKICSGVLFGQTQVLLERYFGALPPQDVYCTPREIPAEYIREWNREKGFLSYSWEMPKDGQEFPQVYLNIWRSAFDHWLAGQSGADVRQCCIVRSIKQEGDMLRLAVAQKGSGAAEADAEKAPQQELGCSYLVGADGCGSTVRGFIDGQWRGNSGDVVIYQEYCRIESTGSLRKGSWYVFFEKSVGDILCCVHRKDDFLTLCVGGVPSRDIKAGMAAFKQFLADRFQVVLGAVDRSEGCAVRQLPPNLGAGRVLLAGEAAGFVYLNGEGISAAIDSGYRAGQAVAQAIKTGEDVQELYRAKTEDIMRHMERCVHSMHFLVGQ